MLSACAAFAVAFITSLNGLRAGDDYAITRAIYEPNTDARDDDARELMLKAGLRDDGRPRHKMPRPAGLSMASRGWAMTGRRSYRACHFGICAPKRCAPAAATLDDDFFGRC